MNVGKCFRLILWHWFQKCSPFLSVSHPFCVTEYCIFGEIRAEKRLWSGDTHGLNPSWLYNEMKWNIMVWISEWKQNDYFLVCSIFCSWLDLMIHCILQNLIFSCVFFFFSFFRYGNEFEYIFIGVCQCYTLYCGRKNHLKIQFFKIREFV